MSTEDTDRATREIDAELKRIEAGDVDAVEAWANDPKVCHSEIEKAALLSLCRQLREWRERYAELAEAARRLAGKVHDAVTPPGIRERK